MVYQQAHTGIIRKLFVGGPRRRGGVRFILAPPPARLSERLGQTYALHLSRSLSHRIPPAVNFLALSFSFSIPLAPLFSSPPSLSPTLSRLSRRARSDAAQLPLAGLTQPNPRANFIPRRLTTTDGRRRVLDAAVAVAVVVVVVRHRTRSRDTSTWSSANRCVTYARLPRILLCFLLLLPGGGAYRPSGASRYYCDWDIRD